MGNAAHILPSSRARLRTLGLALLLLLSATLLGCDRRPLEFMYSKSVRVIVRCIWTAKAYPEGSRPSGVTLYFFRDGEFFSSLTTANVDSCEVQLEKGWYQVYMISQSPEEFWKMEFENMTDYRNAAITLKESSVPWTRGTSDDVVVENPDVLIAGVADDFEITEEMTEEYQHYYGELRRLQAAKGEDTKSSTDEERYFEERVQYYTVRIPIYPQNVVSQLWVTIYSGNADVLKSVRASTSGMARSFELTQNTTSESEAVQIIDQWRLTMDDSNRRVGHVDGIITTLGLPNGESPSVLRDSTLNVSALLIDNATTADYTLYVGDKIQTLSPNPGYRNLYRLVFGSVDDPAIVPPDVSPPDISSASGMDATVGEWEDGETIEVPM